MSDPWSKVCDSVYVVEKIDSNGSAVWGGGLCIHPDGLIISVANNLCFPGDNTRVLVKNINMSAGRSVQIVHISRQYNLCLLWVNKDHIVERFPYVKLSDTLCAAEGESVFSFLHMENITFSLAFAKVSYPLPFLNSTNFSTIEDFHNPTGDGNVHTEPNSHTHFRTVKSIAYMNPDCLYINPCMPLVEVSGFFLNSKLCYKDLGYPTFKESGEFIGLMSFRLDNHEYVIPANFIHHWVTSKVGPYKDIRRPGPSCQVGGDDGRTRRS